jgi:hypothetical protein
MKDLEIARRHLKKYGLTLVIVNNGKVVFQTYDHGIRGLLEAIEKLNGLLDRTFVADRIMGLAAALLCLHARVEAVYAVIASGKALELLEKHGVYCKFEKVVPMILDRSGEAQCPFEKLASEISSIRDAYHKLKKLDEEIRLNKT